jgi:hypothetical protein
MLVFSNIIVLILENMILEESSLYISLQREKSCELSLIIEKV